MTLKKEFLQRFNEAFAQSDIPFILENVTDDITWTMHGDFSIQGKEAFAEKLNDMASTHKYELEIKNIITHGKEASVNGMIKAPDEKTYAFCDVYSFKGFKDAMIKNITSFVIRVHT